MSSLSQTSPVTVPALVAAKGREKIAMMTAYDAAFAQTGSQHAESVYVAKLDADAQINVRSNAAATAKNVARELAAHRSDDDAAHSSQVLT